MSYDFVVIKIDQICAKHFSKLDEIKVNKF